MSKEMKLGGKLVRVDDVQEFQSGFKKREFVIETEDGQYSQMVKFELHKDNVNKLANLQLGQSIEVHFNIRGNEHKGKVYNNLVAWKLVVGAPLQGHQQQPQQQDLPMGNQTEAAPY